MYLLLCYGSYMNKDLERGLPVVGQYKQVTLIYVHIGEGW